MDINQLIAYEWAKKQNYTSVAASYAKLLMEVIDQQNDEYLALKAENERLRDERRWIPTSERLPEIWCYEDGEPIEFNVMLPGASVAMTLCFNGSQWYEMIWSEMRVGKYVTVTHWMPLPEPPKED
jgi:hypothetical protein